MNRPWSVTVILVFTFLFVGLGLVTTLHLRTLGREGYLDPHHLFFAMSPVHMCILVAEGSLAVGAAIFLYLLKGVARIFYLGILIAQILDVSYFYVMTRDINLDLTVFIFVGLLLYSHHLYRRGYLN